jgi:hypothetical protein
MQLNNLIDVTSKINFAGGVMTIFDLEHLEDISESRNIIGSLGITSSGTLVALTFMNPILDLSIGNTDIIHTAITDIPSQGITFVGPNISGVITASTSKLQDGTVTQSLVVVGSSTGGNKNSSFGFTTSSLVASL